MGDDDDTAEAGVSGVDAVAGDNLPNRLHGQFVATGLTGCDGAVLVYGMTCDQVVGDSLEVDLRAFGYAEIPEQEV